MAIGEDVTNALDAMLDAQNQVKFILKEVRETNDGTRVEAAIKSSKYPDKVVIATVIALVELTAQHRDGELRIISQMDVLTSITFLDSLDVQNMKVTGI